MFKLEIWYQISGWTFKTSWNYHLVFQTEGRGDCLGLWSWCTVLLISCSNSFLSSLHDICSCAPHQHTHTHIKSDMASKLRCPSPCFQVLQIQGYEWRRSIGPAHPRPAVVARILEVGKGAALGEAAVAIHSSIAISTCFKEAAFCRDLQVTHLRKMARVLISTHLKSLRGCVEWELKDVFQPKWGSN